jgi:hypothetical protein
MAFSSFPLSVFTLVTTLSTLDVSLTTFDVIVLSSIPRSVTSDVTVESTRLVSLVALLARALTPLVIALSTRDVSDVTFDVTVLSEAVSDPAIDVTSDPLSVTSLATALSIRDVSDVIFDVITLSLVVRDSAADVRPLSTRLVSEVALLVMTLSSPPLSVFTLVTTLSSLEVSDVAFDVITLSSEPLSVFILVAILSTREASDVIFDVRELSGLLNDSTAESTADIDVASYAVAPALSARLKRRESAPSLGRTPLLVMSYIPLSIFFIHFTSL